MAKNAAVPKKKFKKEWLKGYLFILPNFIGFLIFMGIPIIMGLVISFTNYDGFKTFDFVGLSNYIKMFSDEYFPGFFYKQPGLYRRYGAVYHRYCPAPCGGAECGDQGDRIVPDHVFLPEYQLHGCSRYCMGHDFSSDQRAAESFPQPYRDQQSCLSGWFPPVRRWCQS